MIFTNLNLMYFFECSTTLQRPTTPVWLFFGTEIYYNEVIFQVSINQSMPSNRHLRQCDVSSLHIMGYSVYRGLRRTVLITDRHLAGNN